MSKIIVLLALSAAMVNAFVLQEAEQVDQEEEAQPEVAQQRDPWSQLLADKQSEYRHRGNRLRPNHPLNGKDYWQGKQADARQGAEKSARTLYESQQDDLVQQDSDMLEPETRNLADIPVSQQLEIIRQSLCVKGCASAWSVQLCLDKCFK